MDLYGDDRKLSELGDGGISSGDLSSFLEQDVFSNSSSSSSGAEQFSGMDTMDEDWLDSFFEDPVLNDRMITDALQPPHIQSEHSYSLSNNETEAPSKPNNADKDLENEILPSMPTSQLNLNMTQVVDMCVKQEQGDGGDVAGDMATTTLVSLAPTTSMNSIIKPAPTIILATTTTSPHDRLVLPKVSIKMEPQDPSCSPEYNPYDIGLPPTPPSSSTSDSEGSQSPQRSAPSSPIRQQSVVRQTVRTAAFSSQALFSSPIPTSGMLILTEEEKRTLISEGYPIPNKLPLTKQEEKNLKKIRRKIKNKISAQESRRKKKEYLDTLEKRVETYNQENVDLRKKVDQLENNNRSLLSQLQKLQALVSKCPRPTGTATQASTCLMVLVLCFAVFMGSWTPSSLSIGYRSSVVPVAMPSVPHKMQPMGPAIKDPTIDPYSTPNLRSRVLMSARDEHEDQEYGPATPFSYKDLFFMRWFQSANEMEAVSEVGVIQPTMPQVQSGENKADLDADVNHTELWPRQPSITAEITAKVVVNEAKVVVTDHRRLRNATA